METTEYKPTYEQLEAALNKALDGLAIIRQTASNTAHAQTLCEVYERHTNELIAPPPTYKEVTVERWECPDCGSVYMVSHGRAEDDPCAKSEPWGDCACSGGRLKEDKATKLTGTRRVPVKQPVRKRVSGRIVWMEDRAVGVYPLNSGTTGPFIKWSELAGQTGTLIFEED